MFVRESFLLLFSRYEKKRKTFALLKIKTVLATVDTLEKLEMNAKQPSLQNLYFHYKWTLIFLLNVCITWMKAVPKALLSCMCSYSASFTSHQGTLATHFWAHSHFEALFHNNGCHDFCWSICLHEMFPLLRHNEYCFSTHLFRLLSRPYHTEKFLNAWTG